MPLHRHGNAIGTADHVFFFLCSETALSPSFLYDWRDFYPDLYRPDYYIHNLPYIGNPICKIIADFTGAVSKFSSIRTYSTDYLSLLLVLYRIIYDLRLQCSFRIVPVSFCCYNSSGRSDLYFGIRNLYIQEKNRILREKQVSLKKEQLELMNSLELEYQDLRKWNHDIENHLLSMNYLMKTEKYNEARQYLDSISK